jgi:hypothetical protein
MEFSEDNKIIGQLEGATINRLIKKHCRNVVDVTGNMLKNPGEKNKRLSKSETEQLRQVIKQMQSDRKEQIDEPTRETVAKNLEREPVGKSDEAEEFDEADEIYENE